MIDLEVSSGPTGVQQDPAAKDVPKLDGKIALLPSDDSDVQPAADDDDNNETRDGSRIHAKQRDPCENRAGADDERHEPDARELSEDVRQRQTRYAGHQPRGGSQLD